MSFDCQKLLKKLLPIICGCVFGLWPIFSFAQPSPDYNCAVYFSGVGCPHCAKVDTVLFKETLKKYPNLVVIDYEIQQDKENAPLLSQYHQNYGSDLRIPLLIFGKNNFFLGDQPILENLDKTLQLSMSNSCALANGEAVSFENLDIAGLPANPKIWANNRILIKNNTKWVFAWQNAENEQIVAADNQDIFKELLTTTNITESIKKIDYKEIGSISVPLSGDQVNFEKAIEFAVSSPATIVKTNLTLLKVFFLALVDSINPCALAVLALMLVAILTYNPQNKKIVLLSGLTFLSAVFVMYLIYGLLIVKFFGFIQALATIKIWLYKSLGILGVILGLLDIKDFIHYKPGGIATEMPMSFRPKVKRIISGITGPKGAFFVGLFVTLFLLPCTIGPYIICGGLLSSCGLIGSLPWLLFYNLIFILPMLLIVLIIYFGIRKVESVSGWQEKNIRNLHLISGLIMLILGFMMLLGWA